VIEMLRRLFVGLALAGVTACTGNRPPVVTPTPPPPQPQCAEGQTTCCWHQPPGNEWLYACPAPEVPGGVLNVAGGPAQCPAQRCGGAEPAPPGQVQFKELELRQPAPPRLTRGGQPFEPFGAVQCCMAFKLGGVEQNSRWPLASESWMDYTRANFFHFRLGPFYGDADHESEWADTGGPYIGDGPDFNPAFWSKVVDLTRGAGTRKANVEANVIDTWYCKRASTKQGFRDQQMPWPQADIDACGISPSPEQERYIRKVVSELGCFANVVWITDNEGGEIRGTKREWYEWVRNIIRDEEQKSGCGLVHMVGTNNTDFCDGPFDYCATHAREALTTPIAGKHTENNERNPEFSVEQEHSNFVTARAAGLHYWYWRAEQSDSEMERTLALFRGESGAPAGCFAPQQEPEEMWQTLGPGPGDRVEEIRAGQANLGSLCKEPKVHSNGDDAIEALAAEMRRLGYCASKHSDSVTIQSENDPTIWEEYHAVAPYDTGCWSQRPQDYPHNRHKYLGAVTHPPPAGDCPLEPVPTVDEVLCKIHQPGQGLWDCTPKANGRPILPEGVPGREACELKAMGGAWPSYTLSAANGISLEPVENPMQFRIVGSGSGVVTCVVPASSGKNICKGGDTTVDQGVPVTR